MKKSFKIYEEEDGHPEKPTPPPPPPPTDEIEPENP